MSGAWAEACDKHTVAAADPVGLAGCIMDIIDWKALANADEPPTDIVRAGAYARTWRKSLTAESSRFPDVPGCSTQRLLWMALYYVTQIEMQRTASRHVENVRASDLRLIEALLRTAWKQEVGR